MRTRSHTVGGARLKRRIFRNNQQGSQAKYTPKVSTRLLLPIPLSTVRGMGREFHQQSHFKTAETVA